MKGKDNLGPGVKEVVEMAEDSSITVNLQELSIGDKLIVKVGDREKDLLDFVITGEATGEEFGDREATLPGWKFSSKLEKERIKIIVGGSCTHNPGAPLGMTMYSVGRLTVGRNLIIWFGEEDRDEFKKDASAVIFHNSIQKITVVPVDSITPS